MKGDLRRKTRPQGQDERVFRQERFDGGQNSDTVAKKIATNEVALLVNAVGYEDAIKGAWGARLASDERYPGSGKVWDIQQHKVSGRWLLHRGNELWLSAGRKQAEWTRVTPIGPDGSLEETVSFTDGVAILIGPASFYLSNMLISGAEPGESFDIEMVDASGPSVEISLYKNATTLVARGSLSIGSQPATAFALDEQGGSGISAVVDVSGYTPGNECIGEAFTPEYEVKLSLRGITESPYTVYVALTVTGSGLNYSANLYSDPAKTVLIGTSSGLVAFGGVVAGVAGSGLSGVMIVSAGTPDGVHNLSVEFSFSESMSDGPSKIESHKESGFVVFVRGATPRNIFVDQRIAKYWDLSSTNGYGTEIISPYSSGGTIVYRYLYTFSRIVNPANGEPLYSGSRINGGSLEFEGPSTIVPNAGIDYGGVFRNAPVSTLNPIPVGFSTNIAPPVPIQANAAAYITHISIYRTLAINDAATNPEQYVWVADVPIDSTYYEDTATDDLLLARLEANIDNPIYRLQSRGFVPMDRGIGALRDDFMFTAVPHATSVSYCELSYAPRLIGYHNALQRIKINDPVTHIQTTPESAIVLCPSSAHQITPSIFQDVGRGLSFLPIISSQYRVSGNVGVSIGNRPFVIDASSFIAFCTDRTVRVFSGSTWGRPLDDMLVHGILEGVESAVIGYVHGVVLVWIEGMCLRYAFGGDSGSRWSEIVRDHWPSADVASMWEDDDSSIRLSVSAGDIPYVVEDEHGRVYEDEVPGSAPAIRGTSAIENLSIDGWSGVTLYGGFQYGMIGFFESPEDRDAWQNPVGYTSEISEPAAGILIGGAMSGSLDVTSLDIGDFTVVEGIGVVERARIDSKIRFRDLAATQDSFRCMHKSSYASVLFPHTVSTPKFLATWYGDGVVRDSSVVVPANGSIQSFKRIEGNRIQLELEILGSGWQLDSIETRYQTHDTRLANGPDSGPEASYQAEIAQNMLAWLRGDSGLRNRVGGVFAGETPSLISDPAGGVFGQSISSPVNLYLSELVTDFSVMFWAKNPSHSIDPMESAPFLAISEGIAVAFINFVDSSNVDVGPFQFELAHDANDGEWHHYALTRDGDKFRMFQDGVKIGEATLSPGVTALVDTVRAGCTIDAQEIYDARIYRVRISDEAIAYYFANGEQ